MTNDSRIVEFFKTLRTRPEQIAFVVALELCGQNIEANQCKVIFESERTGERRWRHTINVNREVSVVKIALCGKLRAGKDTVANHLYIKHGFNRIAFGDALKKEAHCVFPWIPQNSKPRALYQKFGQLMREIDGEVWIKHAERAVNGTIDFRLNTGAERIGIVITDVRQQNEVDWCRSNGFTLIRVTAPDEVRIARAIEAGDSFVENDLVHSTELAIDGFEVDAEIVNDGSVDELKVKVDAIMAEINA